MECAFLNVFVLQEYVLILMKLTISINFLNRAIGIIFVRQFQNLKDNILIYFVSFSIHCHTPSRTLLADPDCGTMVYR